MTIAAVNLRDSAAALRRLNGGHHHALADLLDAIDAGRAEIRETIRPGQRSAATRERQAERDRLIREAAPRLYPELRPSQAAQLMARDMARYASATWRAWSGGRAAETCPPSLEHDARGVAWRLLKAGSDIPSARTIRRILATS